MRFTVNLIYDEEYKGYVAEVPELPGCMSQGKTVEEALKNVRETISLYTKDLPAPRQPSCHPTLTTTVEA